MSAPGNLRTVTSMTVSTAHHHEVSAEASWTFPRVVAVVAGVFFSAVGVWAMAAPESFFEALATFEPYNQHLLQDIGAFQIGLGAVLLLASSARFDGLTVGLGGVATGSAAHTLSHVIGVDLGGTPSTDIPFFAVLTVLLAAGAVHQRRSNGAGHRRT
jgi:hypothetical protein